MHGKAESGAEVQIRTEQKRKCSARDIRQYIMTRVTLTSFFTFHGMIYGAKKKTKQKRPPVDKLHF